MTPQEMLEQMPQPPADLSPAGVGLWLATLAIRTGGERGYSAREVASTLTVLVAALADYVSDHGLDHEQLMREWRELVRINRARATGPAN